jgi:hypothetical protein
MPMYFYTPPNTKTIRRPKYDALWHAAQSVVSIESSTLLSKTGSNDAFIPRSRIQAVYRRLLGQLRRRLIRSGSSIRSHFLLSVRVQHNPRKDKGVLLTFRMRKLAPVIP